MSNKKDIGQFLENEGIILTAPIAMRQDNDKRYIAFIYSDFSELGVERPSAGKLKRVQSELQKMGHILSFVRTGEAIGNFEDSIRTIAIRTLHAAIASCFVSINRNSAIVWITSNRPLAQNEETAVAEKIKLYCQSVDLNLDSIVFSKTENTPSKSVCLAFIRINSPVKTIEIVNGIRSLGFDVPSEEWMSKFLDNMRKGNLVIRLKDGTYALTLQALILMGTAKDASSPDISRLLALARRGG